MVKDETMTHPDPMTRLLDIMARLRDPNGGCPWDLEQDFASIAPYTIEEAYEVEEAIRANDMASLKEELGDLLLQTVFHSQMAAEAGHFTFDDVAAAIGDKMVARHPHVFGDADIATADAQTAAWEVQKAKERAAKAAAKGEKPSVLDGVALGLPALVRAIKLQNRAARVGFDWPSTRDVLAKLQEEADEIVAAMESGDDEHIKEEIGDYLFVVANLARHLKVDAEEALRAANAKFTRRFHKIEAWLAEDGRTPDQSDLAEMDALWDRAKAEDKALKKAAE